MVFRRLRADTDGGGGVLAPFAARLGWTEGQVYTMAIGLVLALVLLAGHPGTLGGATSEAGIAPRSGAQPESIASPTESTAEPSFGSSGDSSTIPGIDAPIAPPTGSTTDSPNGPTEDPGPEPEEPCPLDAARPLVAALREIGYFPSDSTMLFLERVSGCSETDPALLLIGIVAEFGSGLPNPGFSVPPLPVPYIEVPRAIIDAVQPFRDAIDPICAGIAEVSTLVFYAFGTWPAGADQVVLTPFRQVLLACGQIQQG